MRRNAGATWSGWPAEIASVAWKGCQLAAARSSTVCSTQTWASTPHTRTFGRWSVTRWARTSGVRALKRVFSNTFAPAGRAPRTCGAVCPRPFTYCSVQTTGIPSTPAARARIAQLASTRAAASMVGMSRSWTSTTRSTVLSGLSRGRAMGRPQTESSASSRMASW